MAYNENYEFNYPKGEDFYNVEDFNDNFNKIADELDDINECVASKASSGHTHELEASYITGVLPVSKGGTGQSDVDSEPVEGSSKMITSGGVYDALKYMQGKYAYVAAAYDTDENIREKADFVLEEDGLNFEDMQMFFDDLPSGAVVVFAAGSYLFADTLYINKPVIIRGSGHSTEIELSSNTIRGIAVNNTEGNLTNVTLDNFSISNGNNSDDNVELITAKNVNGLYIYNLRVHYDLPGTKGSQVSIIKAEGYVRNLHIHDCVFNSTMESPEDESYTIDLNGVENKAELCAYISGCSQATAGEFCIRVPDESYLEKAAIYGLAGICNVYDSSNVKIGSVQSGTVI